MVTESIEVTHVSMLRYHLADLPSTDDLLDVLARAKAAGVQSAVLTGGSLHESNEALELAEQYGAFEICIGF